MDRHFYIKFQLEISRGKAKIPKMYFHLSILSGHTSLNLADAFCFNNERDNTYNLRNRETDLALYTNADERIWQEVLSFNAALHWNNLPNEANIAESVSSLKSILERF